jgi:hypothetical protein
MELEKLVKEGIRLARCEPEAVVHYPSLRFVDKTDYHAQGTATAAGASFPETNETRGPHSWANSTAKWL